MHNFLAGTDDHRVDAVAASPASAALSPLARGRRGARAWAHLCRRTHGHVRGRSEPHEQALSRQPHTVVSHAGAAPDRRRCDGLAGASGRTAARGTCRDRRLVQPRGRLFARRAATPAPSTAAACRCRWTAGRCLPASSAVGCRRTASCHRCPSRRSAPTLPSTAPPPPRCGRPRSARPGKLQTVEFNGIGPGIRKSG